MRTADAQRTDGFAGKTIRDLYGNENRDMRGYVTYNYYAESVEEDVGNGVKEMIPRFYTNSDKTSWDLAYIDMTTYSEDEPANADDIRRTLKNYYDAEAAYVQAESNLLPIDFDNLGAVYGLQYLMQTDRGKYYSAWTSAMRTLYQRYSEMRHAVAFKGQDGFMTYTADFDGDGVETSYGDYYNQFCVNYETHSGIFDTNVTKMTPTLKNFANAVGNTQTSTTDTNNKIVANYEQISKYRKAIADAVPHLVNAVEQLGKLYDCVKPGGTLEQKADAWQKTTEDSDVKDTSMAKQDQAEIKDASSYLDADEVQKLIDRINNVIPHLQDMLTQIDSYKFFGTYIGEISDYNSLKNLLKSSIGDYELLHVPTTTAELNAKVSGWVSGKFVIGKPVDITWNKGDSAADLTISNKPKFYDYLHSKFNAAGTGDTDTTEKKEDQENGENLYNKVKSSFSSNASGSKDEAKKGNISNSHEISGLSNLPSSGSNYTTKSMDLTPDEIPLLPLAGFLRCFPRDC